MHLTSPYTKKLHGTIYPLFPLFTHLLHQLSDFHPTSTLRYLNYSSLCTYYHQQYASSISVPQEKSLKNLPFVSCLPTCLNPRGGDAEICKVSGSEGARQRTERIRVQGDVAWISLSSSPIIQFRSLSIRLFDVFVGSTRRWKGIRADSTWDSSQCIRKWDVGCDVEKF